MALTREDLDATGCDNPACTNDHTVLQLFSPCHDRAGHAVTYDKRTGRLALACGRCGKPVAEIAVARSELVH